MVGGRSGKPARGAERAGEIVPVVMPTDRFLTIAVVLIFLTGSIHKLSE